MLLGGITSTAAGSYHDWDSVEMAYPFQDRRLIEFFLTIPVDQLLRPGETRSIQRRAMRRLLPNQILQRKGKKGPTEAILRAISREWQPIQDLLQNAQIWQNGFIDKRAFMESLDRTRMGEVTAPILLLAVIALECWLQRNEYTRSREQGGYSSGKLLFFRWHEKQSGSAGLTLRRSKNK
jgi:asparagine synthase (glutamine-hydrolysing)